VYRRNEVGYLGIKMETGGIKIDTGQLAEMSCAGYFLHPPGFDR
jgi:hypothetical protein